MNTPLRLGGNIVLRFESGVLAGGCSIAVFMGWARAYQAGEPGEESLLLLERGLSRNPGVLAAYAGCLLLRRAAMASFKRRKRSMVTTDVIEKIGERWGGEGARSFESRFVVVDCIHRLLAACCECYTI